MNSFESIDAAVLRKDYAALDELLKSGNVDARDEDGRTPLMYAILAEDADQKMVEFLVTHGADVNLTESTEQWTPLHFAARDQKADLVRILLERGAAVDPVDSFGNTPLWRCVMSTYQLDLAVVDLLLASGADPGRKNNHGSSPIDVVERQGDLELSHRLQQGKLKR